MNVDLILAPFHLDREDVGTGQGPARLRQAGAEDVLADAGHTLRNVETVRLAGDHGETGNIFTIVRGLAEQVQASKRDGAAPVVFAGDCWNSIGVMSGLGSRESGLVWFDAHGDANTPETTESGFFDGFPLAVVLGWCWRALATTVPGFEPLAEERVLHVGGRAFDTYEEPLMRDSKINLLSAEALRAPDSEQRFAEGLEPLRNVERIHIHFDLDVIDEADGHASEYAVSGGPSLDDLEGMIRAVGEAGRVGSATICAYDPNFDKDDRACEAALRMLRALSDVLA